MSDDIIDYNLFDQLNATSDTAEIVDYSSNNENVVVSQENYNGDVVTRIKFNKENELDDPSTLNELISFSSKELQEARNLLMVDGKVKSNIDLLGQEDDFRLERIYNEAFFYGMNSGSYFRTNQLKTFFEDPDVQSELDKIFVYDQLMLAGGKVQPAIILENKDILSIESQTTRREVKQSYSIVEQAKVVSVPKNWRTYVMPVLSATEPELPHILMLPKPNNEKEMSEWASGLRDGWIKGDKAATDSVKLKLIKAGNDLLGMVRYHTMLQQNIVSTPIAFETPIAISKNSDGQILNIGETIYKIDILPEFNGNGNDWRAIPQIDSLILGDTNE